MVYCRPPLLRRNAMRYVVAAGKRLAILAANGLLANDDNLDGNPLTVVVRYSLSCTTTTTARG